MNKAFIHGFLTKCSEYRINPKFLLKYAQAAGYSDMSQLPTADVGQITDADKAAARKYIQQNNSTPAATPQQKMSYRQKQWGFMTPEQQQTFTDWYKQDGRGAAFKAMFQNSQEMDQFLQQHPEFMTGNDDDRKAAIGARLRSMTPEQRQAFRNTEAFKANQSAVAARRQQSPQGAQTAVAANGQPRPRVSSSYADYVARTSGSPQPRGGKVINPRDVAGSSLPPTAIKHMTAKPNNQTTPTTVAQRGGNPNMTRFGGYNGTQTAFQAPSTNRRVRRM